MQKRNLGQFFTTNSDRILRGFEPYIQGKKVTDPFAGKGDLLRWAVKHGAESIKGYDIVSGFVDNKTIFHGDSLTEVRDYDFVLPPYLYQNKMQNNSLLRNSKHTDLYHLALEKIITAQEGIAIVTINFLSAENSKYIRDIFLEKHNIERVHYFTDNTFDDISYSVMAFYFKRKLAPAAIMEPLFIAYPEGKNKFMRLERACHWQIGGEFLAEIKKQKNLLGIKRLELKDLQSGKHGITLAVNHIKIKKTFLVDKATYEKLMHNIVLLRAIDTGGEAHLENIRAYGCCGLASLLTSRNQISLLFPETVSKSEQEELIDLFNKKLTEKRAEYFSLFMTNYRDKNRKRPSFNFIYKFINYLYLKAFLREGIYYGTFESSAQSELFKTVAE